MAYPTINLLADQSLYLTFQRVDNRINMSIFNINPDGSKGVQIPTGTIYHHEQHDDSPLNIRRRVQELQPGRRYLLEIVGKNLNYSSGGPSPWHFAWVFDIDGTPTLPFDKSGHSNSAEVVREGVIVEVAPL